MHMSIFGIYYISKVTKVYKTNYTYYGLIDRRKTWELHGLRCEH